MSGVNQKLRLVYGADNKNNDAARRMFTVQPEEVFRVTAGGLAAGEMAPIWVRVGSGNPLTAGDVGSNEAGVDFVWTPLSRNGAAVVLTADAMQYIEKIPGTYCIGNPEGAAPTFAGDVNIAVVNLGKHYLNVNVTDCCPTAGGAPADGVIVGGTVDAAAGTLTLLTSNGGTVVVPGVCGCGADIASGTYDPATNELTLTTNDGDDIVITGVGDGVIVSGVYDPATTELTLTDSLGNDVVVTGVGDGVIVSGNYDPVTNELTLTDSLGNDVVITDMPQDNIYTADGVLTGNRDVDMDGNTITFRNGGPFIIDGKLTVTGIIDPTGLQFTDNVNQPDASMPNTTIYVTDGSLSGEPAGTIVFKDGTGDYHNLEEGGASVNLVTQADVGTATPDPLAFGFDPATGDIFYTDAVGNWQEVPDTIMVGATAAAAGEAGDVPAPQAGDENKFLKGDGTWGDITPGAETLTILAIDPATNVLTYTDENGADTDIDLSVYIDDTNLARITQGTLNPVNGILTVERDDATTFDIDMSALLSDLAMTGATAGAAGAQGDVPAPAAGDQDKFLAGDGTWKDGSANLFEADDVLDAARSHDLNGNLFGMTGGAGSTFSLFLDDIAGTGTLDVSVGQASIGAGTGGVTNNSFVANPDGLEFNISAGNDLEVNGVPGTAGQVLTSNGDGAPPTWEDAGGENLYTANLTLTEDRQHQNGSNDFRMNTDVGGIISFNGLDTANFTGTNMTVTTDSASMAYSGPGAAAVVVESGNIGLSFAPNSHLELSGDPGTAGQVLTSNGTGARPTWEDVAAGATSGITTADVGTAANPGETMGIDPNTGDIFYVDAAGNWQPIPYEGIADVTAADVGNPAAANETLGRDPATGDLFYKDAAGNWQAIAGGGDNLFDADDTLVNNRQHTMNANRIFSISQDQGGPGNVPLLQLSGAASILGASDVDRIQVTTTVGMRFDMTSSLFINNDAGAAGEVLTSNGPGNAPTWEAGGGGGSIVTSSNNGTGNQVQNFGGFTQSWFDVDFQITGGAPGSTSPTLSVNDTEARLRYVNGGGPGTDALVQSRADYAGMQYNQGGLVSSIRTDATGIEMDFRNGNGDLEIDGSAGTAGQALISQGPGNAPVWGAATGGGLGDVNQNQTDGVRQYSLNGNSLTFQGLAGGSNFSVNTSIVSLGSTSGSAFAINGNGISMFFGGGDDLRVGGSPGAAGQFLRSFGPGNSPAWGTVSDKRMKKLVKKVTKAGEKLDALKPVTFSWKSDGTKSGGFLAQDVEEVLPDFVQEQEYGDMKDLKSIDTDGLLAVAVAALQETRKEVAALKAKVAKLESK